MTINMLRGSLWDKMLLFAVPLALTAMLQQIFNTADVLVLGQFVGKEAMAAVGNNVAFIGILVSLFMGLSLGANVLIAQKIGGRSPGEARRAVHTALPLALLSGLGLMLVSLPLTSPLMDVMDVPAEVRDMAESYLFIYLFSIPLSSVYNFEAAIFRSVGDTLTPLLALLAGTLANAALDLALVGPFGGAGVAWATVASLALSAAMLLVALLRRKGIIRLRPRHFQLDKKSLSFIARVGLPAGLQGMVFCLSNLVVQSAINSLGADAMAGCAAAFTLEINVFCVVTSFGQAATTFVGQNFGARKFVRCRRATWVSIGLNSLILSCSIALILLFDRQILSLFNNDPRVIDFGVTRLLYICGPQVINCFLEGFCGALRGYGISMPPALISLVCVCGVRVVWVYTIFARMPSFEVLMSCYVVSWILTTLLIAAFYFFVMHRMKVARVV